MIQSRSELEQKRIERYTTIERNRRERWIRKPRERETIGMMPPNNRKVAEKEGAREKERMKNQKCHTKRQTKIDLLYVDHLCINKHGVTRMHTHNSQ